MGEEEVRFRPFDAKDTDWMLHALVESYQATSSPHREMASRDRLLSNARDDLERYHHRARREEMILVAWSDEERIGVVWITLDNIMQEDGKGWLLEVYVDPRHRGQGLAKDLLKRAEEWAYERGINEIWLNVGTGNEKALGLYASLGYRPETMHLSKHVVPRS